MSAPLLEKPKSAAIQSGYRGFVAFCEAIGEPLASFQRRIARAHFEHRKVVAVLPKGNFKTSTCALLGLHHLLVTPGAEVRIGAATRRQAEICLRRMKGYARHDLIRDRIKITHFELRHEEQGGELTVVSAEGEHLHGDSPTLQIGDEVWAWAERAELLEAMESSLLKRPDSRLILISTAAAKLDSPLGRLRVRATAQASVERKGAVLEAKGPDLHWLEWSVDEDADLDDMRAVKRANPAGYITTEALRMQRNALPEPAFAQFHASRWGAHEGTWLSAAAWAACAGDAEIKDGELVWAGIDVGGSRSASAVAIVTEDLRVQVKVWQGDDAVLKVADHVAELATRYTIRECSYDPWRFRSEALRLEERGVPVIEFPQTASRMVPASERLYAAVAEGRLHHANDPDLNRAVAATIAQETPRGWKLGKANETDQIDAVVALAMAVDRASQPKREAEFLGWI